MECDDAAVYLVRVIETHHGTQMWFFWNTEIADWVSEKSRATRYLYLAGATNVAQRLSEEQGVEAAPVREVDVI